MDQTFSVKGQIVDVVSGTIFPGEITIEDGRITDIGHLPKAGKQFILPGFIDAHIHIESSMLAPAEFARLAVVHGTVATVSDPHEIANVLGIDGVKFMIRNGNQTPFNFYFGAPSCVPATGFETSGFTLGPEETGKLLARKDIFYLSEMMNFPGVIFNDADIQAKLELARKYGKPVDGHAPGLTGNNLLKYAGEGITTDHECTTIEEALEKIAAGMHILIREGSAARNFETLVPLLKLHPEKVMFCSDDKHPDDLVSGHMNLLVKRAISLGYMPMDVIRACTLNPVRHYNLDNGLLQKGDAADFIITDNLDDLNILSTYIKGEKAAESGKTLLMPVVAGKPNHFEAKVIGPEMLKVVADKGKIRVIKAFDGELLTKKLLIQPTVESGIVQSDTLQDVLKIVVLNRYHDSVPAIGFIQGFGLKRGALASTVAHDSHNLICVGVNDDEMCKAMNLLVECKGGIAIVDGTYNQVLPLPIAGIMTDDDGYEVAGLYESINKTAHKLGSELRAPFMTLSFMALLVIPELKLSDRGLFDGTTFNFTTLFE